MESVVAAGKRCRDVSPSTENDVIVKKRRLSKKDLLQDVVKKDLRRSTASTHTTVTTRIVYGGQVEPKAAPRLIKSSSQPLTSQGSRK